MGNVLNHAPVYFAAAQVRHNPISALATDAGLRSKVLEALRALGFTDQKELKQAVRIEVAGANVELPPQHQLLCLNSDKTSAFVVQQDRCWLQTTHYLDFHAFKDAFLTALGAVHAAVGFDYVDAVSMRMLDAVVPLDGEHLSEYLPPGLLGLDQWAEQRGWTLLHQGTEQVFSTERHRVVFRCTRRPSEVGFPPDCAPEGMVLLERHRGVSRPHAVLDTDAALEKRQKFDLGELDGQLTAVKKDLSQCFESVVTQHALKQWS